jgi:hypothetical protein
MFAKDAETHLAAAKSSLGFIHTPFKNPVHVAGFLHVEHDVGLKDDI